MWDLLQPIVVGVPRKMVNKTLQEKWVSIIVKKMKLLYDREVVDMYFGFSMVCQRSTLLQQGQGTSIEVFAE